MLVEHSEWGTPIVPVLKADGSVKIFGDYKITVNPALAPVDIYQLPRIGYLFAELQGGQYFSKTDLSQAYQQILVDSDTQKVLIISTHKGLFTYTRLLFGTRTAPSIFQKIIENLLRGISGVIAFILDILVTGCTNEEHLNRLESVFQKLLENGFHVNKQKCKFFQNQIEYLGHVIDRLHK